MYHRKSLGTTKRGWISRIENWCPACAFKGTKESPLRFHYLKVHAVTDPDITTYPGYTCKLCDKVFRTPTELQQHRVECEGWKPRDKRPGEDASGWLRMHMPDPGAAPEKWFIYTDGSGPTAAERVEDPKAGWGAVVFREDQEGVTRQGGPPPMFELSGPVILEKSHHLFMGAETATNNTAELTAIGEALLWLRDEAPHGQAIPATIRYDSDYAAGVVTGRLTPSQNLKLVEQVRILYGAVLEQRMLEFKWVKGHSEDNGNERADKMAEEGKGGAVGVHSKRWCRPPPSKACRQEWKIENCRKCGMDFGLDPIAKGRHEQKCESPLTWPGWIQCRLCEEWLKGTEGNRGKLIMNMRIKHENRCRGTVTLNRTCKHCGRYQEPRDKQRDCMSYHESHCRLAAQRRWEAAQDNAEGGA